MWFRVGIRGEEIYRYPEIKVVIRTNLLEQQVAGHEILPFLTQGPRVAVDIGFQP